MNLEKLDRRAFLRGLTITSAGLLVPKAVQVFMPSTPWVTSDAAGQIAFDFETLIIPEGMPVSRIHDSYVISGNHEQVKEFTGRWSFWAGQTVRTQCSQPNVMNIRWPR
jgi:hypothetical protein